MASTVDELLYISVDVWHPSCWTLETTRDTDVGLYGHGTAESEGLDAAVGAFTAYGDSTAALDSFLATARESSLTETLSIVSRGGPKTCGSTTRTVLAEFDPLPSIRRAFTDRGFVHYGPTRHEAGREIRSLVTRGERSTVRHTLERIETEYDADVEVTQISPIESRPDGHPFDPSGVPFDPFSIDADRLSPRQREAFRLARSRGYYGYPRRVTARELATELDITKTTFLEHLRKAEAKLLPPVATSRRE